MKKLALLVSFCLAVGLFASSAAQAGQLKIGYSCNNFNDLFQLYIVEAAKKAAADHNVNLEVMDAQEDVIRQQDQVSTMVQSGVDALVVIPVDTSAVAGLEAAAKSIGVPLIYINRNPYPSGNIPENVYFIGADSILEGETQMSYIGEKLGGKGNIVILMGLLSNEASLNRTQGVHNIIADKYPDIKVLAEETGNWQKDQGMSLMENWITAYGDQINAVASNNDEMVLGAVNALEAAGINDKVITIGVDATVDALQAIIAGRQNATVLQDPVAQGRGAIEACIKLSKGEKVEPITKLPAELVTSENAQAQLDKSK